VNYYKIVFITAAVVVLIGRIKTVANRTMSLTYYKVAYCKSCVISVGFSYDIKNNLIW